MILLETGRLILRNYALEDISEVFEYFSNEEVARYEDFHPMTREEVREMVEDWESKDYRLVVALKSSNKVVGSVGYWIDEEGRYSIDYDFNPKYGKQGYATEAATKLLEYLFEEIKIPEIYGDCDVKNVSSYKLLERLGFERMEQKENQSYKNDEKGQPILISTYLYVKRNKR